MERIFEKDEMKVLDVNPLWDAQTALAQKGVFFLKDLTSILAFDSVMVKQEARLIIKRGESPLQVMGARKLWNQWLIKMQVFAPYYRKYFVPKYRRIDKNWSRQKLMDQGKGIFLLTEVCKLFPFTTHQLRYRAKRSKNPRKEVGVFKDEELNLFLVDLKNFVPWVKKTWDYDTGLEADSPSMYSQSRC
jgi:hypothetical protein